MKSRLKVFLRTQRQHLIAILVIGIAVLVGNAIYISGFRDPTPLLQLSGQVIHADPRLIEGIDTLDPNNGFTSEALGSHSAKTILSGKMPYWNYYEGVGSPLAGEMQSAALSPFTLPLAMNGGLLISHMLLEVVAGFFTFLFLRRLGIGQTVSIVGAIAFALNGTFAWLTNAAFNPIAFLPMLFYGIEVAFAQRREKGFRGWIWIALAVAGSLYAGFPETAFINTLLASIWALVRLFGTEKENRKPLLARLLLGYSVGLLLAAPILIAFLGYLPYANIGGHGDAFAKIGLSSFSLPALFLPYIYGPLAAFSGFDSTGVVAGHWGSVGGYIPISLLVLSVLGLFSKLDKKLKAVLFIWIIAGLLKMFGAPIIEDLWNLIPTIKHAAFFRYVTPSIYFSMLVLAMFGLQELCDRSITIKKRWTALGGVLVIVAIIVQIARAQIWRVAGAPHFKIAAIISVLWALTVILYLFVGQVAIRKKYLLAFSSLIVIADIVTMFAIPQLSTPRVQIDESPVSYLKQNIGLNRFYTLGPIAPNYGSYYEVASINQNDLPVPKAWGEYLEKNLDTNTDPILFIGSYRKDKSGPKAFDEFVRNQNNFRKVGVKYLVTDAHALSKEDIQRADLNLVYEKKFVNIFQLRNTDPYFTASSGCTVTNIRDRASLQYSCDKTGELKRLELYMPGWQAYIDGKKTKINNTDDVFQSISLPKGSHEVHFSYAPRFINLAYLLFATGLSTIVVIYSRFDINKYFFKTRIKAVAMYNQVTKGSKEE